MLGGRTIKHWSSTQSSVALSFGEAEFAGVIRGAGQGLGYQALLRDLGIEAPSGHLVTGHIIAMASSTLFCTPRAIRIGATAAAAY